MYLDKKLFSQYKKTIQQYYDLRHQIIQKSSDATALSKKAIFALHKDDHKEALAYLKKAERSIKEGANMIKKNEWLKSEGSFATGQEEYAEAILFKQYLDGEPLSNISTPIDIEARIYIAALCDVLGEVYRHTIKMASKKNIKEVDKAIEFSDEVISQLLDFNLTKYLRNKFDQAKQAHRKMELISYELRLRM